MASFADKFSVKTLMNVGLFALAAGTGAFAFAIASLPAGEAVGGAVVAAAAGAAVRAAAAVISVAFGGSAFPGQGDKAVK